MIESSSRRKIVIHHCHLDNEIIQKIRPRDLVFFDDCLYSQYLFFKMNEQALNDLTVDCVFGLSTHLLRDASIKPIYAIESHVIHDAVNETFRQNEEFNQLPDECAGMMSLAEVQDVLKHSIAHLAFHGHNHLDLNGVGLVEKIRLFSKDVKVGADCLKSLGLRTDIFVYPYAHSFFTSQKILERNGFVQTFAGETTKRIPIESL